MRKNSVFQAILAALLVSAGVLGFVPAPASAEIDPAKQSTYGVATKGNSNTVASWEALTWEYEQFGNTIFVGGNFLDIKNNTNTIVGRQPYMAALEADTGKWESWWRPDINGAVFAMEQSPDGALFVGGEMSTWNGQAIGALVKIDPATGEVWPMFDARVYGGTNVVRDIKLEADGWLYVVGSFTTASVGGVPQTKNGAVRLNPLTGAIDSSWAPDLAGGSAWGVSRSKTLARTYIAGHFDSVNGLQNTAGFVSVDDVGVVVDNRDYIPFNGCGNTNQNSQGYCAEMYDVLATDSGDIWVGGVEHALYVLEEGGTVDLGRTKYEPPSYMKWFHYSGCDPTLPRNQAPNPTCTPNDWSGGEFQEIEQVGDRVYAMCHCWFDMSSSQTQIMPHALKVQWIGTEGTDYFQTEVNAIIAFDAVTGDHIPSFYPLLGGDSGGFAVHENASDGCIWVAGGINNYGPPGGVQPLANDVVRLCDAAGPGPTASPDGVPPVVPACQVVESGGTTTVSFTVPTSAVKTIVERSVTGGASWFWRGAPDAPTASFSETSAGAIYRVIAKYEADQVSGATQCGGGVPADSVAPSSTVSSPATGNPIGLNPVSIVGTVTDDVAVASVRVWVRDVDSGLWLKPDGSFGAGGLAADHPVDSPGGLTSAFSWDAPALPDGSYYLIVRGVDAAGNQQSTFVYRAFQVSSVPADSVAPTATVSSPATGDPVLNNPFVVTGTSDDNAGVASVRVWVRDVDSGLWLKPDGSFGAGGFAVDHPVDTPGATSSAYSWDVPTLPDGSYYLLVRAIDQAGNQQTSYIYRPFQVSSVPADSVAPSSTVSSPATGNPIGLNPVSIVGTVTDDVAVASVRVWVRDVDSGLWLKPDGSFGAGGLAADHPVDSPGGLTSAFSWDAPALPDGSYYLIVRGVDAAGNQQSTFVYRAFQVSSVPADSVAPTATVSSPATGDPVLNNPFVVTGTSDDNAGVASVRVWVRDVDSGLWLKPDGSFGAGGFAVDHPVDTPGATSSAYSWDVPTLPDGSYYLLVRAIDQAGNQQTSYIYRPFQVSSGV